MLKNYLKVALRNIYKHRMFSLINIFGLSISMATCLLIILLVYGQKKVDDFHEKQDRIVRVLSMDDASSWASTPLPLASALVQEYPHVVEDAVRVKSSFVGGDVVYGDRRIPLAGRYVDENFFKLFDFPLIGGNIENVLEAPFSIVLTKESAEKLFGSENPIGKSVKLNDIGLNTLDIDLLPTENEETLLGDFTVTGVVDTALPSHIQFEFLVSMATVPALIKQGKSEAVFDDWNSYFDSYLYILLKEGKTEKDLAPILADISKERYAANEDINISFATEQLSEITPGAIHQNPISLRMPIEAIYFLSFLGLVVLFSACFNYVNLSFARSLTRSKEIGVRKTMGAARYQVFIQFIIESILISLISLVLAIGMLQILSAVFLDLWINQFLILDLTPDVVLFLLFVGFSILVGCLAGLLPASFLSSFTPIITLRNSSGIKLGKGKRLSLKKGLVLAQFCASLFFIITTLLIFSQLNYLLDKEYGFDEGHIINVKLQGMEYETLANEFKQNPAVQNISASTFIPGTGGYSGNTQVSTSKMSKSELTASIIGVDQNFIPNLKLQLLAGDNFPRSVPKSEETMVVVNEAVARLLGYEEPKNIVGETILIGEDKKALQVIGLTENFIFDLLTEADKDEPLLMRYLPAEFAYMNVRFHSASNVNALLSFMEERWKKLDKVHSFKYDIYEDELKATNSIFTDIIYILGFISFLAITIASLGLLGVAAFTAESKKKEIGIRKVHGAKIRNIALSLSNGYLWLFVFAILITVPVAYFANTIWLEEFSYHVDFSIWIILIGIGIMFIIGSSTVLSQTFRAAIANPVESLWDE
ncbi:ABC transporter permease [Maribacter halichondriae]|uniref:ABC transporter permease n=1 Tax=Maribacter halichondriae TaxID=2980554 RepID=UPI00235A45B4|nr:ABC transporter permease [Maribacter sp. Hal144]